MTFCDSLKNLKLNKISVFIYICTMFKFFHSIVIFKQKILHEIEMIRPRDRSTQYKYSEIFLQCNAWNINNFLFETDLY
jgi:hypothetical protein